MPLLVDALTDVPGLPGAGERVYPPTLEAAAAEWATAIGAYVAAIVPPSTTAEAARVSLEANLAAAFASDPLVPALEAVFAQFALELGLGMAPAFTATPPPGPVGFAELFALPPPTTRLEGVMRVAEKIDLWMRTGIAALAAPPNTAQPWS